MFKPSLRKSILNDNLCIESQKKHTLFQTSNEIKQRPVYKKVLIGGQSRQIVDIPSMMIPQRLLSQTMFDMDHHPDTKVFTPFTYDFRAYPRAVRQFIANNPNAAQAGKCQQINYVVYQKCLFLWIDNKSNKNFIGSSSSPSSSSLSQPRVLLKMHKFSQPIDIVQFSSISNTKIFTTSKTIVLAVVFKNRMKLFIVNSKELSLQDMMLKYQLKGANKIQHVYFSKNNQLIFAGDNGKLSMISLNGNTSSIITVQQSNIIKKYLSRSAFDYSTIYNIRQIISQNNFVYCLYDRIKKENYLLYVIKKAVNKVIKLQQQPKYIIDKTFIDVYKFINNDKQKKQVITLIDRISQNVIQQKVKQGYNHFNGQNIKDGFRIVAIKPKIISSNKIIVNNKNINEEQRQIKQNEMKNQDIQKVQMIDQYNTNAVLEIVTRCGYVISLVHATNNQQSRERNKYINQKEKNSILRSTQDKKQQQLIAFTQQPIKLSSYIGTSTLLEPKLFTYNQTQKNYRKNCVIKSVTSKNDDEMILLMSDSLMRVSKDGEVNVVKFKDLKINVTQTTVQKQIYVTKEEFDKKYNTLLSKPKSQSHQQRHHHQPTQKSLFPQPTTQTFNPQYYRLLNNQRRFTTFDNQGRMDVYLLQLRHVLIAYLSYYLEAKARNDSDDSHSTLAMLNGGIDYDIKLQKILQKIVQTYGYCKTMKALLEILTLNNNQDREFIYFQRGLLIDTIRKQFQSQQPASLFEEWNYSLTHHQESQLIVVNDLMLDNVWSLVFEWHLQVPLGREVVKSIPFIVKSKGQRQGRQWMDDVRTQQKYTAYGNALQYLFNQQLQTLSHIRAREFKQKQSIIKHCQSNLIKLYEFIQQKNKKSLHYRHVIQTKLLSQKKKQQQQQFSNKFIQQSLLSSSTLNTTTNNQSIYLGQGQRMFGYSYTSQANSIVEESILKAIQKIVTLVDVMNILIEKDERQGVPNIIQTLTQFESQLKIGELFYNEQLFIPQDTSINTATFLHPQLIQRVLKTLPQLQLDKKIEYLKFKLSRNIVPISHTATVQNNVQIDLKSLDLQRLAKLITSANLTELNKTFLSQQMKLFSLNKAEYYTQFLVICLTDLITKVNQLVDIKQLKFNNLSQEVKKTSSLQQLKSTKGLMANYSVEKILLAQQKLAYYQNEMVVFYQEVVKVFKLCVDYLTNITGPEYYEAQKYLQRIIQMLVCTFPNEQVLIQTIKIILKDANMVDKVQYVRTTRKKMQKSKGMGRIFVDLGQQNGTKIKQRSTFDYLLNKNGKQSNHHHDRTIDTWRNINHSTQEIRNKEKN